MFIQLQTCTKSISLVTLLSPLVAVVSSLISITDHIFEADYNIQVMDALTNVVHSVTRSIVQSAYCKEQAVKYATFNKCDMSEIFEHWLRYHLNDN